jgi:tRNA-specific adenosine deaminase 1
LHDSHAEIIAIRAFNRYVLEECRSLLWRRKTNYDGTTIDSRTGGTRESSILQRVEKGDGIAPCQPFSIRDNVSIYLYNSKAPCGDASMELLMKELEDSTPWIRPENSGAIPEDLSHASLPNGINREAVPKPKFLPGRGYFSELGIVRRKPCMSLSEWLPTCTFLTSLF